MSKVKVLFPFLFIIFFWFWPTISRAMPPGTILYRTSGGGKLFGYSDNKFLSVENGILKDVYAGHSAIYIGKEDGEDYIVEAMAGGIVKTPAKYFVNRADGEVFLGAKLPSTATPLQRAKAVALAKSLADSNMAYDSSFKNQKGPKSGDWTCVGLIEKIYESANVSNPNNLGSLEYDSNYYAVDITPDGYNNYSVINSEGDCLARDREFSKIARREKMIIPAPELIGFDLGLEYNGERYVFLPYTQFLQSSLASVEVDLGISSSFSSESIRGPLGTKNLALRWSLINNPLSSFKKVVSGLSNLVEKAVVKTKEIAKNLGNKIFSNDNDSSIVLSEDGLAESLSILEKTVPGKKSAKKNTKISKEKSGLLKKDEIITPKIVVNKSISPLKTAASSPDSGLDSLKKINKDDPSGLALKADPAKKFSPVSLPKALISKSSISTANSSNSSAAVQAGSSYSSTASNNTGASNASSSGGPSSVNSNESWSKLARLERIYSTGNNDWVELYNPTEHDFDLATVGYRLEKAKTADDPSLVMRLGNLEDGSYPRGTVIKAKGHYLIVRDGASTFYKSKADAIATRDDFNWSESGYTIYLGKDAISSSSDSDIVDAVGFGLDATYFQGSGPAPAIPENYILNRINSAGNNKTDFNLIPSDDPSILAASTSATSTSNNLNNNGQATTTSETADNGNIASSTAATSTNNIVPLALIKKIYSTGNNDWIELFNPTNNDFDLATASYRLEKTKTAEDPSLMIRIGNLEDGLYPSGTIIKANSPYLIIRDDANLFYKSKADAIATRDEFSWDASGYTIYLGSGPISSSTDLNIIGAVGYGPDATYFEGSGPAPAINDNYILNRIATSGNNMVDFSLIPSDDPNIVWAPNNNATSTTSDILDLFIPPDPINSPGLTDLWHFDGCRGIGEWVVGRFDCAKIVKTSGSIISFPLKQPLPLNSLSTSFYYKSFSEYPKIKLSLFGAVEAEASLSLEPGVITIDGLPNSQGRYFIGVPFGQDWHKVNLTVNQESGYWALYLDGREIIKENFMANLPVVNSLGLSNDGQAIAVDEIAVWGRSLDSAEIAKDYVQAAPYNPSAPRPLQRPARLLNFWDFMEGIGPVAADIIGQNNLLISPTLWTARAHDNYAVKIGFSQNLSLNFSKPFATSDLSLAFWWRNSSFPGDGRTNISLSSSENGELKTFSLLANYFRLAYYLDNKYGILSEGLDKAIPNDDKWHHLALVYDSYRYKLRFYVDGEEVASKEAIGWPAGQTIKQLNISSDGQEAELDDLAIYEGALSPIQIKNIYSNNR